MGLIRDFFYHCNMLWQFEWHRSYASDCFVEYTHKIFEGETSSSFFLFLFFSGGWGLDIYLLNSFVDNGVFGSLLGFW